jgi:hypothetical protein
MRIADWLGQMVRSYPSSVTFGFCIAVMIILLQIAILVLTVLE